VIGNPDLAVLKAENQNPTHVTPTIATLAQGLVRETLVVVGPRPVLPNKTQLEIQKKQAHTRLCNFVLKAKRPDKKVNFKIVDRIARGSRYLSMVEVDGDIYRVRRPCYICDLSGNLS
jgi:DNA (cytosine-5)-methyltransferase 1